jgi:hypothetical protein
VECIEASQVAGECERGGVLGEFLIDLDPGECGALLLHRLGRPLLGREPDRPNYFDEPRAADER